ncbi:ELMO domain-containing protein 3 isoform X2 [Pipra filicauda]|uniref:ELMO domain-containing protein 3 isoform X2 n=1 Tax=Pipra filicauda TaxID=649802 RepID=A0A7R5KP16_9PASS|nr:ELMO domain-containing protein 3 isoform X2 [Pipra filicauda]
MSGAGGSERPEQRPERRPRVFPPIPALGQDGVLQALVLGEGQCSDPGISEEQLRAQEEWEALEEIQSGLGGTSPVPPPPISFAEALQHFQSSGLSQSRIPGVFLATWGVPSPRGVPPPPLPGALDDSEWVHMRILQTIYRQLTRSRRGCPRYGTHWEELGFQGVDPGTDLRGTGMLGLMQILFFVLDSRTLSLAREIFQLSQHETQNFPFCIMSVNITRIVIQALREERLSRECNRRQQVIGVLNDLYAAAFLQLFRLWKRQCGTVADAGSFLKELELSTKKKPRQLLRSLEAYVSHSLRPFSPPSSSSQIHFTGICDPVVELEGDSRLI